MRFFCHSTDRGNSRQIAAFSRQFTLEFCTHYVCFFKKRSHPIFLGECRLQPFLVGILHGWSSYPPPCLHQADSSAPIAAFPCHCVELNGDRMCKGHQGLSIPRFGILSAPEGCGTNRLKLWWIQISHQYQLSLVSILNWSNPKTSWLQGTCWVFLYDLLGNTVDQSRADTMVRLAAANTTFGGKRLSN